MVVSKEEWCHYQLTSLKILTYGKKETFCNTDASDDFTVARKKNCSNNDSALVTALKDHTDSLKRKISLSKNHY